jgi:hypothetical protein
MSAALSLHARVRKTGFVTKALFLRGRTTKELEARLGYAAGRLEGGYWLLFLEQMPTPEDFEFMGYSQMSGGIPLGHLHPPGGRTAEQSLIADGMDMSRLKKKVIRETFRIDGPERLAKVIPLDPAQGPMPYPPGSGIPQWRIVEPGLNFRVAEQIAPGGAYFGRYD